MFPFDDVIMHMEKESPCFEITLAKYSGHRIRGLDLLPNIDNNLNIAYETPGMIFN